MFSSPTADFGLSKIIDDQVTMKTVCGTPGYCGEYRNIFETMLHDVLKLNGIVAAVTIVVAAAVNGVATA